jgi:hypothetical protein
MVARYLAVANGEAQRALLAHGPPARE